MKGNSVTLISVPHKRLLSSLCLCSFFFLTDKDWLREFKLIWSLSLLLLKAKAAYVPKISKFPKVLEILILDTIFLIATFYWPSFLRSRTKIKGYDL